MLLAFENDCLLNIADDFFDSFTLFIECPNIDSSHLSDISDHREIFERLEPYITFPPQIMFSYKTTPTNEELDALGENIQKLVDKTKITGNIINNKNYKVNVQLREAYGDPNISVVMDMIIEDINSGERMPGHAFMEKGKTIAIDGPEVNYAKILKTKVKSAKNQYDRNHVFITAINTDSMLGAMNENIQCIESLFQPDKNTRYSSVLFTNHQCLTADGKWTHIVNPYADKPATEEISRIFR